MAHNIFFWDHEHREGGNDDSKSKVNLVEAQMAARLALYMVQQGYAAGEVTILTPYVGQLRVIAHELGKLMDVVVGDIDAEQLASLVSLPFQLPTNFTLLTNCGVCNSGRTARRGSLCSLVHEHGSLIACVQRLDALLTHVP